MPTRPRPSRAATTPRRSDARRAVALLALLSGLLAAGAAAAGESPRAVDYLYADANEGGASGGHVAIRFGDEVFHFEYRAPGLIRLRRDRFEALRHRYTVLDNRSIVLHRVPVSQDTYQLLREAFGRRRIVQDEHLRAHDELVADRRLLEALLARHTGRGPDAPLTLEGAGFFFDTVGPALPGERPGPGAPALVALRDRVASAYGPGFVEATAARIMRQLRALAPEERDDRARELAADSPEPVEYGFAARYRDQAVALLALDVLREARPLRADSLADAAGAAPAFEPGDAEMAARLSEALESSLVRLLRSDRPDWGFPLFVGMARLIALDRSLRAGRWAFLDAFPADAPGIPAAVVAGRPVLARALLAEARGDFAAARGRLTSRSPDRAEFAESDFADLEAAGNRLIEIARSGAGGATRPMRLGLGPRVPSRDALLAEPFPLDAAPGALARHASLAGERERRHAAELRRLYGYDLVTKNCATEIFRTIDAALASVAGANGVRRESEARLGGHVDVDGPLAFIPAVWARTVRETYAVTETVELPSYRLAGLARIYARDGGIGARLREANTLTSTLYERNPADSAFLFFTDDVVATRPLLGAINLAAGFGASAAGLLIAPTDGGALLRAGLHGVLWSLPELVFFNVRKGSLLYAPRRTDGDPPG